MARARTPARKEDARLAPAAARLVDAFEAIIVPAAAETADAIRAEIPAYAGVTDERFAEDLNASVVANLEAVVRTLRSGRPPTPDDLLFVRGPTTRRAQRRIPLGSYLHAFRIGHRVIWRTLVSGADDDESRAAALTLVEPVIEFIDIVSTHVAEVYVEAERLLLAEGERVRRDLLDDLLSGRRPRPGPRADTLAAAGLSADATLVVVSALPAGSAVDEHALRAAAAALGRSRLRVTSPLAVQRGDEVVAILPAGPGDGPALAAALRTTRAKLSKQGLALSIGASTVATGLEQVPTAYREAAGARSSAGEREGVLALCELGIFEYLTLIGDETATRLIPAGIARFVEEDLADGGVLIATLREYADANLNAKAAAERLFIHVNTAHYRLGRIAERTGRDLRSLHDVVELLLAVKLTRPRGAL